MGGEKDRKRSRCVKAGEFPATGSPEVKLRQKESKLRGKKGGDPNSFSHCALIRSRRLEDRKVIKPAYLRRIDAPLPEREDGERRGEGGHPNLVCEPIHGGYVVGCGDCLKLDEIGGETPARWV